MQKCESPKNKAKKKFGLTGVIVDCRKYQEPYNGTSVDADQYFRRTKKNYFVNIFYKLCKTSKYLSGKSIRRPKCSRILKHGICRANRSVRR